MNKLTYTVVLLLTLLFAACKQKAPQTANQANKAYYTCSMHPQVHEEHDGNCPICGMKLIKVELTDAASANTITLNATQLQLAGIQTDTVREENTGNEKMLTGTVTTNENTVAEFSARLAGRVQQLFIRSVGQKVAVGQPVYSLYSEDLQEAQKEYLLAKQQQKVLHNPDVDYNQLISGAENKLKLWGLSASQIKNLAATNKVSATTTILSTVAGTVSDIGVHEGDYVTDGMTVLKTQGLNSLWVEAQLYASEAGNYKEKDLVNVSIADLGGPAIKGKVDFINPELSGSSKVALIRISIPNPQGLIRPGMLANIAISGAGQRALAVPVSAILTDGEGSKVWVKNTNGSFSPRVIKAGAGNQNYVSIISGLNSGEIVVINGAYLLNSEAIFKNGSNNSMTGMKM
ncbi:Cu(I)/Ag(I) efflux system membrane fusion protein [Mucilaginibacter gracilis]|uniref:Cu(I)/Ag(I) efflux system membrane fusion protein n=1 Tax=Mucilaginibacter gracilis TaxID=423350 RepID=A0A495J5M5_9SPHI|nr:efflux RND transporter periplasmic adaptor subunit [Mucilaginibacter gracilis]RKR83674.1 Cu(I)/Ag(I) efflux system membrane fusion protein [Mucilaginibacter gracilis]